MADSTLAKRRTTMVLAGATAATMMYVGAMTLRKAFEKFYVSMKLLAKRRTTMVLAGATAATMMYVGAMTLRKAFEKFYVSVKLLPPSEKQLQEENHSNSPLFRLIPGLREKFAWRELGSFPTPVHRFELKEDETVEFWVKREDLSGSEYGGNKVRSLQFPLASCEVQSAEMSKKGQDQQFIALGSGGSNMVVASKLYSAKLGLPASSITGVCMADPKEMDNTLNYLSALSMPGKQELYDKGGWTLLRALWNQGLDGATWLFAPGGNCPGGVLGQVGGVLELAEQIASGEVPDPDHIVLPMGSLCTCTGIVVGVALARTLGIQAFRSPHFCILGLPIHPGLIVFDMLVGLRGENGPLMIGRGIREVNELLVAGGSPDIKEAAFAVMRDQLEISHSLGLTGSYGVHSKESRKVKDTYDKCVTLPEGQEHLWLCGHFTAKAFGLFLRKVRSKEYKGRKFMIWQTKSAVQPKGPEDEWAALEAQKKKSRALTKWAVVDGVSGCSKHKDQDSKMRPATGPEDYRGLMKPVLQAA